MNDVVKDAMAFLPVAGLAVGWIFSDEIRAGWRWLVAWLLP